ncbi:MAG: zinc ribbon domain-containing protein [Bryobacterales bacterium]
MAENRCSCGFELPEGAVFCPGCGRPLTPEAREQERIQNALPRPKESPPPPPVGFSDLQAIRACYWPAVMAALLANLPGLNVLCFLWHPGAGFLAVHSYRRRTGRTVDPREGARLGAMTGVISSTLMMVLLAVGTLLPGSPGIIGGFRLMQQEFEKSGETALAQQLGTLIADPPALALALVIGLTLSFAFTVGFAAFGGVVGARVLADKD